MSMEHKEDQMVGVKEGREDLEWRWRNESRFNQKEEWQCSKEKRHSYKEGRWGLSAGHLPKRHSDGEESQRPAEGYPSERQSNGKGIWRPCNRDPLENPCYNKERWHSRENRMYYKESINRGNVQKRLSEEMSGRQEHSELSEPCTSRDNIWKRIRLSAREENASNIQNDRSHENHRPNEETDGRVAGGGPEVAHELCTCIVTLCTLYYIRLQKERQLREMERRKRLLLFRRARTRQRLHFAVLWTARLFASGEIPASTHTDEKEGKERRIWSKVRSSALWDTVIEKTFSNFDWTESFRMTKSTFDYLCEQLRPVIQRVDTNMRRAIPAEVRLAMTLWRLGSSCEYRTIEKIFGVSRSTICKIVRDVCEAVVSILTPRYIRAPRGDILDETMRGFEEHFGLQQLAGVVGAFHVAIRAPNECTGRYFNTKGWHSVVLQAVVDSNLCFWDLNIGCPGNLSDSQVLLTSELYEWAREGTLFPNTTKDVDGVSVPIHILGPRSYPLLPWLMTPLTEHTNPGHEEMNRRFSSALGVAQTAFAHLKSRWRCLLKRNDTDLSFLPTLIAACCTLHNVCESCGDPFEEHWQEEATEEELEQPSVSEEEEDEDGDVKAEEIRTALVNILQH
ncbi:uncharacterized protein O3C94_009686 [Discoglossus pictus]